MTTPEGRVPVIARKMKPACDDVSFRNCLFRVDGASSCDSHVNSIFPCEVQRGGAALARIQDVEALEVAFECPDTKALTTIVFMQRPLGIAVPRARSIAVSRVTLACHAAGDRPRMTLRSFNGQDASEADSYDSFIDCVSL